MEHIYTGKSWLNKNLIYDFKTSVRETNSFYCHIGDVKVFLRMYVILHRDSLTK